MAKISNPFTAFNRALYLRIKGFLDRELQCGYVSYQRQALPADQQQRLHAAQAAVLSQELDWLAQRYAPGAVSRSRIEAEMAAEKWQQPPLPQIREQVRAVLWNYIADPAFEFELSPAQKERFMASLLVALESGAGAEELKTLIPRWLPPEARDDSVASDLAVTLAYKVGEVGQRMRVDTMWSRLQPLLGSADENFEKKAKSVLFDLSADIIVLPQRQGLPPHGRRLAVRHVDQTGYPLMLGKMDHFLFRSLLQSILLCYGLTLVFMAFMRRSLALGLISTLPVIFTSVVMFGLLALIGIPLDYATMMIGGVSIGVGIDYTIHFIHGFLGERDGGQPAAEAIRRAFLDKGKAILTNALSVMAGFAVLLLSSLLPLRNFAWAMVCSMLLAALAALTLLPASLLVFDPKIKIKK
jgi:hypothetical protein